MKKKKEKRKKPRFTRELKIKKKIFQSKWRINNSARELKINSPQFARIFLSRSMERWESRVEDHEIETFTGDENKFPSPGGERHRPVRLKHARHVEKCGVKVGKSRYRVIWCIYTRTYVALPQRQGFLRDIKFLINRISGSKVEGRKKREGRASATAKPLERDFRRCTRHANGWRGREREEGGGFRSRHPFRAAHRDKTTDQPSRKTRVSLLPCFPALYTRL